MADISINQGAGVVRCEPDGSITLSPGPGAAGLSFFNETGPWAGQQTVTGSKGANVALASLITALANLGLIVDGSS